MAAQAAEMQYPVLADFKGQGTLYEGLVRTLQDGSFVHAYLISGPEGIGKRSLARCMAQSLLCTGENPPCGKCPACMQVRDENHPDVLIERVGAPLNPEEDHRKKSISVDEMRYLLSLVGQHTFTGGRRVVIIEQAEKMTTPAANALLKTLEEPPEGTVFLLLTDSTEMLLPTIVSRCRTLRMHAWSDAYIQQMLINRGVSAEMARKAASVSGGSIGKAIAVAADEDFWSRRDEVMRDFFGIASRGEILRVSTALKERKDDAQELLDDLEDMIRTLLLIRLGRQDDALLAEYPAPWQRMAVSAPLESFITLSDALSEARKLRVNQVTWQAVVEKLLLRMMEERSKWST